MDNKLDFLYEILKQEYNNEELKEIHKGYTSIRPLTFRVNKLKSTKKRNRRVFRKRKY